MNRQQRRAARRAGVPAATVAYAETYRCPDCASSSELHVLDGVPVLDVRHDDTCPTYRKARLK